MKLIIGLGNPGPQYHFTRHNFGFLALDFHAKTNNLSWGTGPKFRADVIVVDKTIYAKPQTFYNNVGESIQKLVNYYKIDIEKDLLVICDDFDLPFGTTRMREHGTAAGNNGLKSTIQYLGTQIFHRLRLGTNNPDLRQTIGDVDFVLSKFTPEERQDLPKVLTTISAKIHDFTTSKP